MRAYVRHKSFIALIIIFSVIFFLFGWHLKIKTLSNESLLCDECYRNDLTSEYNNVQSYQEETNNATNSYEPMSSTENQEYFNVVAEQDIPSDSAVLESFQYEFKRISAIESPDEKSKEENQFTSTVENIPLPEQSKSVEILNNQSDSFNEQEIPTPTKPTEKDAMLPVVKLEESSNFPSTNRTLLTTTNMENVTTWIKNPALILDTPACKIPKFDPMDPTVKHLIFKQAPYECPGPPLFMIPQPDGSIALNRKVLKKHYHIKSDKLICSYQSIYRKYEDPGGTRENNYGFGDLMPLVFGVSLNEDFVYVNCNVDNKTFEQYFPLIRLKENVEQDRNKKQPPKPKLNVILAGIDSVSKLNFLRHFPKTNAFLKEKLFAYEMNGYTKVGENTFPNLVPLLTGHFVDTYWNDSVKDSFTFDSIDLIWKEYAKRGYRTFYAEDSPYTGTFNYLKRGFLDPPTDYYIRTVQMAADNSQLRKTSKAHCFNSQIETDFIQDYLRDFTKAMGTRPYIAFQMVSTITHDYLNQAGWMDEPTVRLLEDLLSNGTLENSMLVLFSDHGLRFGAIRQTYIGKFEERMPFMFIYFPKWFLEKYPHLAKNLRQNQERLMTLFDVHATMIHLLDLDKKIIPKSTTLGSSLLYELSSERTCEEANIHTHFCPCQTFQSVPLEANTTTKASVSIVDDINDQLSRFEGSCAHLQLDTIMDARFGQANDIVMKYVNHESEFKYNTVVLGDKIDTFGDYLITLTTKPGGAVFEGTVRYNLEDDTYSVLGISRISMYGNQSWCIDNQKMKKFCYCNYQITS